MSFIFNSKYNSQSKQVEINKNNIEELQKQNFTIYNTQLELTQDSTTIAVTQTDIDLNNIGNALLMSRNGLLFKIVTIEQGNVYLRYYANIPTGPQGLTGPQGPKGEQGVKGDTGATGPQGPQGPKGEQGIQGLKGDTGPAGPIGPQGPQGEQGIQGIQGPQGIQGNKGDKGDNGNDFTIQGYVSSTASLPQNYTSADVGKAYLVGVTTPRVVYLWGYNEQGELIWSNQGYLQGPQGEQGPQGVQGVQGEQGVQGLQGVQGEQGPKGDTGDTGPIGPQGPAGIQGPKGDTGLQGPQGPKGDTGPQGPQGVQGPQGETGPQGPAGANINIETFNVTWSDRTTLQSSNMYYAAGYRYSYTINGYTPSSSADSSKLFGLGFYKDLTDNNSAVVGKGYDIVTSLSVGRATYFSYGALMNNDPVGLQGLAKYSDTGAPINVTILVKKKDGLFESGYNITILLKDDFNLIEDTKLDLLYL